MNKMHLLCLLLLGGNLVATAAPIPVAYRPDPPISIDGDLREWGIVPFVHTIDSADQLIFAADKWDGPADLSGLVHFAWRPEGLFVAAEVTDDVFRNSGAGFDMFRGDHLELFIDTEPGDGKSATRFQFGISPGDLDDPRAADAFGRINPEVYRFSPQPGRSSVNALVDGKRTPAGWNVEALIPWSELELSQVKKGQRLWLGVALCDRDQATNAQETMMSLAPAPRDLFRSADLLEAMLADSDGTLPETPAAPEPVPAVDIAGSRTLAPHTEAEMRFELNEWPAGLAPVLHFGGLLESGKNDGYTEVLFIDVNGTRLDGERLTNKSIEMPRRDGDGIIKIYNTQFGLQLPYASSFDEANLTWEQGNPYAVLDSEEPRTDFDFDLTGVVKPGVNTITFRHQRADVEVPMHLRDIRVTFAVPAHAGNAVRELGAAAESFFPGQDTLPEWSWQLLDGGQIRLTVAGEEHTVTSLFSRPGGIWSTDGGNHYTWRRAAERRGDVLIVRDTFENRTATPLGIMQRHEVEFPGRTPEYHLNGLPRQAGVRGYFNSSNDTSFAGWEGAGIGLAPESDAFRIHAENYLTGKGGIGLCDRMLVIAPQESYTAEWLIIPAGGSYWNFINALRRFRDVNFELDGNWTFLQPFPPASDLDDAFLRDFFAKRKARFVSYGDPFMKILPDGDSVIFAKGAAMLDDSLWIQPQGGFKAFDRFVASWRRAAPGIKVMSYYQCFLDSHPDSRARFGDAALLSASGQQQLYGADYYPIFLPIAGNEFSKAMDQVLDLCFDRLGADGIFWDEMSHSLTQYHYGEPWDRVSGDIDLVTHEVSQLKSSVSLVTESWRWQAARRILERGPLVANGMPYCKRIRELKFPAMTETAQSSFAARGHVYTPIILSDHLSESTFQDTYNNILKGLDYGCVFYFYRWELPMPYETITSHMYPITPVELGAGFIIGEERILTRRSGLFGWGDDSAAEVFIYDNHGKLTTELEAPEKIIDGKRFREIRLYPGYSAALVRQR